MIEVNLTGGEYLFAATAGFYRQVQNVLKGRLDAHGFNGDGWEAHILGAVGEFVCAKAYGLHWAGPGTLRGPDVGTIQVRTRRVAAWPMILHREDDDDAVFVAVVQDGGPTRWRVKGWARAGSAKRPEFWADLSGKNRPAFFVPDSALERGPLPGPEK